MFGCWTQPYSVNSLLAWGEEWDLRDGPFERPSKTSMAEDKTGKVLERIYSYYRAPGPHLLKANQAVGPPLATTPTFSGWGGCLRS